MNFVTVNFKVGAKNPRGFLFEITLQLKFEAKNPRCILQFLGTCSVGLAKFAWAESDFDAGCMGASYGITKFIPTFISPPLAFPIQHKANIGL